MTSTQPNLTLIWPKVTNESRGITITQLPVGPKVCGLFRFPVSDPNATVLKMTVYRSSTTGQPVPDGKPARELVRATSRQVATRELREAQELALSRMRSPETDDKSFVALVGAYTQLRESIRIEKGVIKPGSRNISVRELSRGEQIAALPAIRRRTDYLADAQAVAARAAASAQPTGTPMPDASPTPDSAADPCPQPTPPHPSGPN